jgi:hypothetical protein
MPAVGVFATSFVAGFSGAAAVAVGGSATAFSIGAFLGTTALGTLLVNLAVGAVVNVLLRSRGSGQPITVADAYANVRLDAAPRWIAIGTAPVGGAAGIFMEHDADGAFWYIVAHADAELTGTVGYILDGVAVTLSDGDDGFTAGDVLTEDFCVTTTGDRYEGTGTKVPVWRLYTVTPTSAAAAGTLPAAFTTAFPNLPSDFAGVGVCFTIVRGAPMKPEKRGNGYRWRGPIGIGEPTVTLVGRFSRAHDPRDIASDVDDAATWPDADGNAALAWAWFRTHPKGRNDAVGAINWDLVEAAADICDETVQDRSGNAIPRYRCGIAFPDSRPRYECEADILRTFDAFVAYDDEGRAYPVPGKYAAPTLTITRERDILTATTQIVDDGEADLDGVIVEYISPEHGYTRQESAPWVNDLWYDGVSEPRYAKVSALGVQDHNQAVRIAKAFGQRTQPARKAALGCTIKGILAKNERAIDLAYDGQFAGAYEIVTPVEEDGSGQFTRFAAVPLASDRWSLGVGEEGVPPQPTPALNIDDSLEIAQNVVVYLSQIATSSGNAVRIEAAFDAPSRVDRIFRFRYVPTGGGPYQYFTTDMEEGFAYSAIVEDGVEYRVSWQTLTAGGRATLWSDDRDTPEFVDITATAAGAVPAAPAISSVVEAASQLTVDGTAGADTIGVRVYRATTDDFSVAVAVSGVLTVPPLAGFSVVAGGLASGAAYFWIVPVSIQGVEGPEGSSYLRTIP